MAEIEVRRLFGIRGNCTNCGHPAVATVTETSLGNLATPRRLCRICLEAFALKAKTAGITLTGDGVALIASG